MNHCRCCSKLEEIALSPRVGRLFIIIAITLITIGTITYFNVIFPTTLNTPLSLLFSIYLTICTTTHYYWACTTQPGSPATEPPPPPHHHLIQRHCPKCLKRGITPPLKPERAHHCRHCGQCQLKYDHHCPWINQCVGLRNERFFLLFLFYLSISCAWIVYWGWPCFTDTFDFATPVSISPLFTKQKHDHIISLMIVLTLVALLVPAHLYDLDLGLGPRHRCRHRHHVRLATMAGCEGRNNGGI